MHRLYRKPEKVFKPTETPLFLTVFVGLTGFEPATSCFRGVFLVGLNGFLLRLISLEKWRFLIFGCLCCDGWDWLTVTVIVTGFLLDLAVMVATAFGVSTLSDERFHEKFSKA